MVYLHYLLGDDLSINYSSDKQNNSFEIFKMEPELQSLCRQGLSL